MLSRAHDRTALLVTADALGPRLRRSAVTRAAIVLGATGALDRRTVVFVVAIAATPLSSGASGGQRLVDHDHDDHNDIVPCQLHRVRRLNEDVAGSDRLKNSWEASEI